MTTYQTTDLFLFRSNDGVEECLRHFGFREQPFGVTPNPAFLFSSRGHHMALQSIVGAIEANLGFTLLLGDPGMGKTTLLFQLLTQYRDSARTAFIFQTQCKRHDLLRHLVAELELPADKCDEVSLHQTLKEMLVNEATAGRRVLVIIDEAQNLQASSLETIRLLSDFETTTAKLLHIILAGSARLSDNLASSELSQLAQRISTVSRLYPLSPEEAKAYVTFRLGAAGHAAADRLFLPEALAEIAEQSRGIPRVINSICYGALSLAYIDGAKRVGRTLVRQAVQNLDFSRPHIQDSELPGMNDSRRTALAHVPPSYRPPNGAEGGGTGFDEDRTRREAEQFSGGHENPYWVSKPARDGSPDRVLPAPGQNIDIAVVGNETAQAEGMKHGPSQPAGVPRLATSKINRLTMAIAILGAVALLLSTGWYALSLKSAVSDHSSTSGKPVTSATINTPKDAQAEMPSAFPDTRHPDPEAVADATPAEPARVEANARVETNGRQPQASVVVPLSQSLLPSVIRKHPDSATEAMPSTYSGGSVALLPRTLFPGTTPAPNVSLRPVPETATRPQTSLGRPTTIVKPEYPREAQLRQLQGDVLLELQINSAGNVQNVRRVSGNALLSEAAERAARQWHYRPFADNQAAPLVTMVSFNFTLKGKANK
jgi:TonB family protein